jgi:hypothetical protein
LRLFQTSRRSYPARLKRTYSALGRHRIAAVAVSLLAVAGLAVPATANALSAGQSHAAVHNGSQCTRGERLRTLAYEQRRVLKLVGRFRVIRNAADLAALGVPNPTTGTVYNLLPHMYDSMLGMGFTVVNAGAGGPGKPTLLLYRPDSDGKSVTQPFVPDFPYRLAGWGYVSPYTPGQAPTWTAGDPGIRCLLPTDWLIHERSVHPATTWQNIAVPPVEQYKGQVAGSTAPTAAECQCVVGLSHGRFWDVHIWLGREGVPTVTMFNPGKLIPGFDPKVGLGFFYPAIPPL